jgi:hypothetical protein
MKTQGIGRKMHPKEVLPAIAPFISRERREKVELENKGGPVGGGPKTRPTLWWYVGRWTGPLTKAAPLLGPPQKWGQPSPAGPSPMQHGPGLSRRRTDRHVRPSVTSDKACVRHIRVNGMLTSNRVKPELLCPRWLSHRCHVGSLAITL